MNAVDTACQEIDVSLIDEILQRYPCEPASLIGVLQDVSEAFHYLPRAALEQVSEALQVPMNQIYHVATFYKAFHLTPQGKHTVCVCEGTACHVKGAGEIMEALQTHLGVSEGDVTQDGLFTVRSVRCLGCCALAPLIVIDEEVHGLITSDDSVSIIKKISESEQRS